MTTQQTKIQEAIAAARAEIRDTEPTVETTTIQSTTCTGNTIERTIYRATNRYGQTRSFQSEGTARRFAERRTL